MMRDSIGTNSIYLVRGKTSLADFIDIWHLRCQVDPDNIVNKEYIPVYLKKEQTIHHSPNRQARLKTSNKFTGFLGPLWKKDPNEPKGHD